MAQPNGHHDTLDGAVRAAISCQIGMLTPYWDLRVKDVVRTLGEGFRFDVVSSTLFEECGCLTSDAIVLTVTNMEHGVEQVFLLPCE